MVCLGRARVGREGAFPCAAHNRVVVYVRDAHAGLHAMLLRHVLLYLRVRKPLFLAEAAGHHRRSAESHHLADLGTVMRLDKGRLAHVNRVSTKDVVCIGALQTDAGIKPVLANHMLLD